MKSILFLIPSLGGGGAERVLVNLVNNLDQTKFDIYVQTLFDIGINRRFISEGITYIPGIKKQFAGNTWIMKLLSPKMLYKLVVRRRYDIVVSYLEGPTARIVAGCPFKDSALVSWIHREQGDAKTASRSFRSFAEAQECYGRFGSTAFVSCSVQADLESVFEFRGQKMVLYNVIEDEQIRAKAREEVNDFIKPDGICVFTIGRLSDEKGYDRLVRIHAKLLNDGLLHQLFVLGEGPERGALERKIHECGVKNTFHLLGFKENPYKYLSLADLFVCSSRREGFSTAVTEALILGIPVVSTRCSGAEELLGRNGEYGIVTNNDEDSLERGIRKMLISTATLTHYRRAASERALSISKTETLGRIEAFLDNASAQDQRFDRLV